MKFAITAFALILATLATTTESHAVARTIRVNQYFQSFSESTCYARAFATLPYGLHMELRGRGPGFFTYKVRGFEGSRAAGVISYTNGYCKIDYSYVR